MHHGRLSKNTAKGLKVLRQRIGRAKIPSSSLDERITIATWNIREFGRKRRKTAAIHYIAEIIGQFDLVALTEVRDNLRDLERVLQFLGPYWKVMFSDYMTDSGGNRERVAYVYDKRAVVFTGLAAEPSPPRKKVEGEYLPTLSWWRAPFMASFRAGNFDFILITTHIRWGSGADARVAPLKGLADWIHKRRTEPYVIDKDIVLMGDFNIPKTNDPTYRAITSRGLRMPAALRGVRGTNLSERDRYDQILAYPRFTKSFTKNGGTVNFVGANYKKLFPGTRMTKKEFTYQLSDHLPLWIEVDVDLERERLDQALNR
ncbi:MAG: endonuclease/exonuclease/phosphatase family protein [Vicinamibacterales bacterium]|jgi:endonuclease/exonuclease/phosphatase family metal-dependent hydrolase|nr:endonuclease [Acidobacteriota bacterium]MDP6371806.1 endonuclease/exonuclease/phosphatase family protein [Vicinamibacterales bacterium]MDP6609807.1 endonuclease/exonuclease/phosphatase family protein [Vicinamibacterales bacterium]|tara:strand:- start:6589 stop:7536 length:948 start_codon:yes stop_codon:yes gene_type:complete